MPPRRLLEDLKRHRLPALLLAALGVRILFLFWGSVRYYGPGEARFVNGDSPSYAQSALNLLRLGRYTFDPSLPDAAFGRLPGYPLFWAIHALIFGEAGAYLAVAVSQVLLDTLGVYLIWLVARRAGGSERTAWIAAALVAFYPFSLIWVTVTGTETMGVFLCLLFLGLLTRLTTSRTALVLGAVAGVAFLTRPYLLTFLPAALAYWYASGIRGSLLANRAAMLFLAFALVYLPWPARNLLNHDRLILTKPLSAGYLHFYPDFAAFRAWVYAWQPGLEPYHRQVIGGTAPMDFPPGIFADEEERAEADRLISRGYACGTGFRTWMNLSPTVPPCDTEVAAGFQALRSSYMERHPVRGWIVVPALNLRKAVFKSALDRSWSRPGLGDLGAQALFLVRTALVLLGFAGIVAFRRTPAVVAVAAVSLPIYLAFAWVFRQIEMRYLIQADVLLLLPAAMALAAIVDRLGDRGGAVE